VEEIVGNIADEYERPAPEAVKRLENGAVEVDARMNITELNRELSLSIPEAGEVQTIGGFVIVTLGVIPNRGDVVEFEGVRMTVEGKGGGLGASVLRLTAPRGPHRLQGSLRRGRGGASEKSFELDELGAFVWGAVDGTRSVEGLIEYFSAEKRVNIREAEVAV